jgi:hypothetical protein
MPVNWPRQLVERIAANQWVLFLGSGVAASCLNAAGASPPAWADLLRQLCQLIRDNDLRAVGEGLISAGRYLYAADHIRFVLDNENNLNTYLTTLRLAVAGPAHDPYRPSSLYDVLLSLDPSVVFTTNYDKLFETASANAYSTHQFDSATLGSHVRRGDAVLVKLHGSTDSIDEVVLTRTDYSRVIDHGRRVLDIFRALCLTSTILFVGYSLDDPDIQLVLQATGRQSLDPEAHFMLAPEPDSPSLMQVFRENYGVTVLPYPAGRHPMAEESLRELSSEVLALRATMSGRLS